MKVAVSAREPNLESAIDPRFGRCPVFILVDPETMEYQVLKNADTAAVQGAGIHAAQLVANKGVEAVITGEVGPNAARVLSSAGVRIIRGVSGMVREAVESYRSGEAERVG